MQKAPLLDLTAETGFEMRGAEKLVSVRDEAAVFQQYAEVSGLLVSDDRAEITIGFQKLPDHFVERDGLRGRPDQPCGSTVLHRLTEFAKDHLLR